MIDARPVPERAASDSGVTVRWLSMLRRRWATGIGVGAVVMAFAVAILLTARPVYRAEARLRLGEPPPMGGASPTSGIFGLLRVGGDPFANDLELLDSRSLAEDVVTDAGLNVHLIAPRGWHRDSIFTELAASLETDKATFEIRWTLDTAITIRMLAPEDSVIGTASTGVPVTFGGVRVVVKPRTGEMPESVRLSTVTLGEATRVTRSALIVERARRDANVIDLFYNAPDPGVAQAVVTSAVTRFQQLRHTIQRRESGETVDSLRSVASETMATLRRTEDSLQRLQERTRLIDPDVQGEALVERFTDVAMQLAKTEAELDAIDSVLAVIDGATGSQVRTALISYPAFLGNETIGSVLQSLIELEQQRSELSTRRTDQNREMRILSQQIDGLDEQLRSLAQGYRRGLTQAVGALRREFASLDSVLAEIPSSATQLARLQRQVMLLSQVYVVTEQRLMQEELREALTFANIQVIDPPALRDKPVWPRKLFGLAVAVFLAGVFGLLAVLVREQADRSIRYGSEVTEAAGIPVLLTVRRDRRGGVHVEGDDAHFLHGNGGSHNGHPVTLVGVAGDRITGAVAEALNAAAAGRTPSPSPSPSPVFTVGPQAMTRRAAASVSRDVPVTLVVEYGRTRLPDLRRAVTLLSECQAKVDGAIVVCPSDRSERDVWS